MNTFKKILILSLTLGAMIGLDGAIGCMDNSQHLKQKFDTKAYHYVSCDCPCRSKAPGTNRCARCGHLMVPLSKQYVTAADGIHESLQRKKQEKRDFDQFMQDPDKKLQRMIQGYRHRK